MSKSQKKVQVVTSKGHVLAVYESQVEAARRIGIKKNGSISAVCNGRQTSINGFIFRHASPHARLNQLSLQELQQAQNDAIQRGLEDESEVEAEKSMSKGQKKVQVVTSRGRVLAVYESQIEAARRIDINSSGRISAVCNGRRASIDGFIFRHAPPEATLNQLSLQELQQARSDAIERGEDDEEEEEEKSMSKSQKKVQVVTSKGHVLAVYESQVEAARRIGIKRKGSISAVCNDRQASINGFIFRHASPHAKLNQLSLQELQQARRAAIQRGLEDEDEEDRYDEEEEEKADFKDSEDQGKHSVMSTTRDM